MDQTQTTRRSPSFFSWPLLGLVLTAFLSTACGNWDEFGNGPLNPHNTIVKGPVGGLNVQHDLLPSGTGASHGAEVGVMVDRNGDYYVSSYKSELYAYDHTGAWMGVYSFGFDGPRAAPYVSTKPMTSASSARIFTGAEGGGFHVIDVDKTTTPFTMTLADSDLTLGTSESSPKRAGDKTFYIAGQWGDIVRYDYSSASGLSRLSTFSLGEVVTGAIALYDVDPQFPDEEVLVATTDGNFYVLDHTLSMILWSNTVGAPTSDLYYAGVTVAERGSFDAIAVLPIAADGAPGTSPNSGKVRAINLNTRAVEWEMVPSQTVVSRDAIEGSVAILHNQQNFNTQPGDGNPGGGDDDFGGGMIEDANGNGGFGGGIDLPDVPTTAMNNLSPFHATFASTDAFLYGIDLLTGFEIWNYPLTVSAYDAPVVDVDNIIYVGDGSTTLHAVEGKMFCPGCGIWTDNSINIGGVSDIVKLGVTNQRGLVVGSGSSAYALFQ